MARNRVDIRGQIAQWQCRDKPQTVHSFTCSWSWNNRRAPADFFVSRILEVSCFQFKVLHKKLFVAKLINKFSTFYRKLYYRVKKSLPLYPFLSYANPVHTLTYYCLKIYLNIIFPSWKACIVLFRGNSCVIASVISLLHVHMFLPSRTALMSCHFIAVCIFSM